MPKYKRLNISAADYTRAAMPVLIIHGTKDRNAAYSGELEWARSFPNARLLTVDDAAHVPWIEAPELVFRSIKTSLNGSWPYAYTSQPKSRPASNIGSRIDIYRARVI